MRGSRTPGPPRSDTGARRADEAPAERHAVSHLGLEAVSARAEQVVLAHPAHGLAPPQRVGATHRVAAPCRRHAGGEPERRLRGRVVADRHRDTVLLEAVGLVDEEPVNTNIDGQAGDAVGDHQAQADVEAAADLGVAAVLADPHLDARRERHARGDRRALRPLERGAQPRDPRPGRPQVAGRSGCSVQSVRVSTHSASALKASSKPASLVMSSPRPPPAAIAIDRPVSIAAPPPGLRSRPLAL